MSNTIEHRPGLDHPEVGSVDGEHPPSEPVPVPAAEGSRPSHGPLRLAVLVAALVALGVLAGWPVLLIVGAIIVSVFLHELGHFLVARWAGMKVSEFFIGFGPRLWSFHRGETEYGVKAIPAGAYVRIIGMHSLEEVAPADEARSYRSQPYHKRLLTVLAGPFMNFLIGIVLLFVVFAGFGAPRPDRWTVGRVLAGSSAEAIGVQPGDRIVSFDGRPVGQFDDISSLIQPSAGREVQVVVERDGEEHTLTGVIGWRLGAEAASALPPLAEGDQIVDVDGTPVTTYQAFAADLAARPAGSVPIHFDRHGYLYATSVQVPASLPVAGYEGFLGIGADVPRIRENPVAAVGESGRAFGDIVVMSVQGLGRFFSPSGLGRYADLVISTPPNAGSDGNGSATVDTRVTPVAPDAPAVRSEASVAENENRVLSILGVVRLGAQAADGGPVTFLLLLITVNVFLGLINLVPLLPFDGGHAAVATYEAIRGRITGREYRVNMAKLLPITYAVVFLLIGLGLSSMYLDVVNPAQNPFSP